MFLVIRWIAIRPGNMLAAHNAVKRRGVKRIRWILSWIHLGILRALPIHGSRIAQRIAKRSMAGYRLTNILAALSTRFCTCSIHASSRGPCRRRVMRGLASRSTVSSPKAWWFMKPIVMPMANGSRLLKWKSSAMARIVRRSFYRLVLPLKSARSKKCRNQSGTRLIPTISSAHSEPIRRAGSCFPIRLQNAM